MTATGRDHDDDRRRSQPAHRPDCRGVDRPVQREVRPRIRTTSVGDVAAMYDGAPVQDYVVVLVTKEATDALRKLDALHLVS